jgi:general secretion pathway protein G
MSAPGNQRGFTILEIVIAIGIMSILAGTIVPMVGSTMADGKRAQAQSECKAIAEAIGRYRLDVGTYPPGEQNNVLYNYSYGTDSAMASLSSSLVNGTWKYLTKAITRDPWGRPYYYHIYAYAGTYMDVAVLSAGPDGAISTWDMARWNTGQTNGDDIAAFFDL